MLSKKQLRELQNALIDAFPTKFALEQMLYYQADKSLDTIAGGNHLEEIVFNLIRKAESEGWIFDLICAARKENSGNPRLGAIATELLANNPTPILYSSSKEDAIAKYRKKVEEFLADDDEISFVESEILKSLQSELELTEEETRAVRDEVLKPLGIYQENLDKYRQVFTKLVDEQVYLLSRKDKTELKKLQEYYQLKDEDIALLFKEAEQQKLEKFRPQLAPSDDLSSDRGGDYTRLRDLLKAGQWKEADEETLAVMLKVAGRKNSDSLDDESIKNFPCTDLRTIDQLWVKYSNGRFGFSVQKQIYLEVGGIPDGKYYPGAWSKFDDRVEWKVSNFMMYHVSLWIGEDTVLLPLLLAPRGHLPLKFVLFRSVLPFFKPSSVSFRLGRRISSLAWRLVNCNL